MASELVLRLVRTLQQFEWPVEKDLTAASLALYEQGLELVDSYHGDERILREALRIFSSCGARPYALAGIAYVMNAAAFRPAAYYTLAVEAATFSQFDQYDQDDIQEALGNLSQAQEMAPDRTEIDFIEVRFYADMRRLQDARLVLDYLQRRAPDNYHLCLMEIVYWRGLTDLEQARAWYERAIQTAANNRRRVNALMLLALSYFRCSRLPEAIRLLRQVTTVLPNDPWIWCELGAAHARLQQFTEAEMCVRKALSSGEMPAARELEAVIQRTRLRRQL